MSDITAHLTALKNAINEKPIDANYTEDIKSSTITKLNEIGTVLGVTQFGGKRRRRTKRKGRKGKKSRKH